MSAFSDRVPGASERLIPSGTVTFAFTDIEGSTLRWERHASQMQDAVRRHDGLVRASIEAHGGFVFKTIGDAFCAAFSRPEDAIAAMLAVQHVLASEDFAAVGGLHVRAAVHTGTADERDGDYFGPAVNRVARLLAICHGAQTLVSGVTSDLAQGALPHRATLRYLGEHRLKDLARPEHIFQLVAPGLARDFPPLRSLGVLPNNLPVQLTSFVARETEIAELTALVEQHRLVTLVGAGGIGKTRLSLQVAANLLDGSGDGVWFIELAPIASGDYIPTTVAQAMGLALASEGDPLGNLVRALKAKRALLLFDNCEHLIEPAATAIAALLRECPAVKIVASSRQGLGIAGEEAYRLPSLGFPAEADTQPSTAGEALRSAAVALFLDRARAVDKRFVLTEENVPAVVEICRMLDGIPLAIELAAARVKVLSPRQLRERLGERFRLLTGGSRDLLPRQQTLRALIDWSYDLLDEREQRLFCHLSIFVNGFNLEGAMAVGSGGRLEEFEIFDALASLVDKSLVQTEPHGDTLRYRLLESTRAYAGEKLKDAGDRDAAALKHLGYLRDRFVAARALYEGKARWGDIVDALASELEDVRVALDYALSGPNILLGSEILASIGERWEDLGLGREWSTRLEAYVTALRTGDAGLLSRLWAIIANHEASAGRSQRSIQAATKAVALGRVCDEPSTLANALRIYAQSIARTGRFDEAEELLREADPISDGSVGLRLRFLGTRGVVSVSRCDFEAAVRAYEQLRSEHRQLGNTNAERWAALNLAESEYMGGRADRAIVVLQEILPDVRAHSARGLLVNLLANLAGYLISVDETSTACAAAREAIREFGTRDPQHTHVAISIEHLALALLLSGDFQRASLLSGYADAALRRNGYEREYTETKTYERLKHLFRRRSDTDEVAKSVLLGAELAPESAVALALREP